MQLHRRQGARHTISKVLERAAFAGKEEVIARPRRPWPRARRCRECPAPPSDPIRIEDDGQFRVSWWAAAPQVHHLRCPALGRPAPPRAAAGRAAPTRASWLPIDLLKLLSGSALGGACAWAGPTPTTAPSAVPAAGLERLYAISSMISCAGKQDFGGKGPARRHAGWGYGGVLPCFKKFDASNWRRRMQTPACAARTATSASCA